jgi:hypothetical protein
MGVSPDLWGTWFPAQNSWGCGFAGAGLRTAARSDGYEPLTMIHEILPSDVEFARGLINSSHSDAEILAYLASRGIETAQAAKLVDDLRHGRQPSVQVPFVPFPGGHGTSGRAKVARAHSHHEYHAPQRHSRSGKHRTAGLPWWFVLLLLIFVGALIYLFLGTEPDASKAAIDHGRHEIPSPPGK